jgi:predicted transcriptional regulator
LYIIFPIQTEDAMPISTVNISFPTEFLEEIDKFANAESRTRSELIREATRMYLTQRKRWDAVFAFGTNQAAKLGLREEDITAEIRTYRARKER